MKDIIVEVPNGLCCQFMYKGLQVSFTTCSPAEVVIFPSKESIERLAVFQTVAEAIDWINGRESSLIEAASKLYEMRNVILTGIGAARHRCVRNADGEWTTVWVCDPYTQAFKDLGKALGGLK